MARRLAVLVTVALGLIAGMAADAHAKGAESVTLSGPGIDTPIELIDASKSFDSYENSAPVTLVGLTAYRNGGESRVTPLPGELGPAYTLTWVYMGAQDVPMELRIYLEAVGGPLIHIPVQEGLDGWQVDMTGWFEAPGELPSVIEEVVRWSASAEGTALQPSVETPPLPPPAVPEPKAAQPPLWLLLSAVVGVVVLYGARTTPRVRIMRPSED